MTSVSWCLSRHDAVLPLPEIETELPLAEIYEGVDFSEEADEE